MQQATYCVGVDIIGQPIYVVHYIDERKIK